MHKLNKSDSITIQAKPIIPGAVVGAALVSSEPLSFWGGINPRTGEIIDRRHGKSGQIITGKIFFFPNGRGSSTSSGILMECVRNQTAPAAIVNSSIDAILALGSIVSDELYKKSVPVMLIDDDDLSKVTDGDLVEISSDGRITITKK